ncbi:hypothetical protein F6R98_07370 [Candidatus Methylospira mobilis]|uniref:Transposase n=1 Tax=Candidatus Methylospira mobilis TaxID=1808979 RepID=A0A5Q0BJX7_9GAMM|nr:hypothetical protein F6R98_07370 [Candidatus Methylospira mobilis]
MAWAPVLSGVGDKNIADYGVEVNIKWVLQHALPKGFHRARNFGFLHPNSKRQFKLLQLLLKRIPDPVLMEPKKRPALCWPCCGGEMKIVRTGIKPGFDRFTTPEGAE